MNQFLINLMDKLDFPKDSKLFFLEKQKIIYNNILLKNNFEQLIQNYQASNIFDYGITHKKLIELSENANISQYTVIFLFFLNCTKIMMEKYKKANIPQKVFWNTIIDMRHKLLECKAVHGEWGTFVGDWFIGFFNMKRFGLGRLQYEEKIFKRESIILDGTHINKGDKVLNLHIPSSGPLTKELREDSYKKAYSFYKNNFKNKKIIIQCNSWLLFPDNRKFYPKNSNILDFMNDFYIIDYKIDDTFNDAWRVFGKLDASSLNELPANTSLQKAYIKWLKEGNKTGTGFGIIIQQTK